MVTLMEPEIKIVIGHTIKEWLNGSMKEVLTI